MCNMEHKTEKQSRIGNIREYKYIKITALFKNIKFEFGKNKRSFGKQPNYHQHRLKYCHTIINILNKYSLAN